MTAEKLRVEKFVSLVWTSKEKMEKNWNFHVNIHVRIITKNRGENQWQNESIRCGRGERKKYKCVIISEGQALKTNLKRKKKD